MNVFKKIKDKMYYYFAEKNWGVRREYGPYVEVNCEEHLNHRAKHWRMLICLNWHYRVMRKSNYLYKEAEDAAKLVQERRKAEREKHAAQPFSDGIEKIADAIRSPHIKVVSFDVFDTLLFRPVLTPADTFRLLENYLDIPNFHNMRVTAEAEARKYKPPYIQDITLDDIYNMYAKLFHASEEEISKLKEEELKIEYTTLYARKSAQYLFNEAKKAGKKIIIISDMYLSSEFLDKVLRKNGYEGYEHIYVSSETGVLKSTKLMYDLVLSDLAIGEIQPQEVLHIGDNKKSDVDCATAVGMNAKHLPKAVEMRNNCRQLKRVYSFILMDVMNSNNSMMYGILLNLYFDDPFVRFDRNSYFDGNPKLFGYWFAPLMFGFSKWMIERVEKRNIEQLLWVWRDGYIPSKLFNIMRPYFTDRNIEISRIYLGRDFRLPFSALDKNGLFTSLSETPFSAVGSVDDFITNRLLCTDEEEHKEIFGIFSRHGYLTGDTQIGKFENYRGFIYELEPYFIKNAKAKINLYREYIAQNVSTTKNVALFDRSPRGKSSRFLEKYFDIETVCFTTEVYDTYNAKLTGIGSSVERYLEYGKLSIERMGSIWAQLFEILISDRTPGFKDIIKEQNGVCSVKLGEQSENNWVKQTDLTVSDIQNGIIEFVQLCSDIFRDYLPHIVIDRHGVFDYSAEAICSPYVKDAKLITSLYPGTSNLAPLSQTVFTNWYNRKFKKAVKKGDVKPVKYKIKDAVKRVLDKMGLTEHVRPLYNKLKAINGKNANNETVLTYETLKSITDRQIDYLQNLHCSNIDVLILGSIPQEVGTYYFNNLYRKMNNYRFMFVAAGFMKIPTWLDFPVVPAPESFSFWGIEGYSQKINISQHIINTVNSSGYLSDLKKRRTLRGYSESVAAALAYEAERYFTALIDIIQPKVLVVWNNWGNNSVVPKEIAKRKGIPVLSAERGFLEGTLMFSRNGYGQDMLNTEPKRFCALPVSTEETETSAKIISYLGNSGYNRYAQPENDMLNPLKKRLDNGRFNVLFIGAFDYENPGFPKNDIYSPTFSISNEAMQYLSKLAKKNSWNLIYKPHPLLSKMSNMPQNKKSSNVFYIRDGNINDLIDISDVVVCMISGVSYIALTRGKPLVSLGATPLWGKGCCYEPSSIDDVETQIKQALQYGYTKEQEQAFIKHVAQVSKYYYFDDLTARPIRYGRSVQEACDLLTELINEKENENNESCGMGTDKTE